MLLLRPDLLNKCTWPINVEIKPRSWEHSPVGTWATKPDGDEGHGEPRMGAKDGERVCILILLSKTGEDVCLPTLHPKIGKRVFLLILFPKIWIKGLSASSTPKDWRKGLYPSFIPKDWERISYPLQPPDLEYLDAFVFSFAFLSGLNPGGCREQGNGFARLSLRPRTVGGQQNVLREQPLCSQTQHCHPSPPHNSHSCLCQASLENPLVFDPLRSTYPSNPWIHPPHSHTRAGYKHSFLG